MRHTLKTIIFIFFLIGLAFSVDAAKVEDFMPKDSMLYVKLQHIDEVYGEIETAEIWQEALALLPEESAEIRQGIAVAEAFLSTNLLSVLETVGYQTALTVWLDETRATQIGFVVHSGGNLSELQRFTKIAEGAIGLTGGNTLRLDAGVYQRVRYNVMEMEQNIAKYGFVGDFLLLGVGEGAFEKLMDIYRKKAPSIRQNPKFAKASKKLGAGVAVVFADVPYALSLIDEDDLDDPNRERFAIFQSLFLELNLLETGPFLQVVVGFNPNLPENEIGLFLTKGETLKTLNALSDRDDLFVVVASTVLESVWDFIRIQMEQNATGETYAAISFLEGLLNLNLKEDVMTGLKSELALSVPDLTHFDPQSLENINLEFDGSFEFDAESVETNGALIFFPSNRMKWNQIGNSLSNLQNVSITQMDYNGTTVLGFASSIYYSEVNNLFLMGFSEEQVLTLIERIKKNKKPAYLKQMPKMPVAFAQLNLARFLEVAGEGTLSADKVIVSSEEIAPLLAWISVEDDEASLEITLSEKETPLEGLAKLVPFYVRLVRFNQSGR